MKTTIRFCLLIAALMSACESATSPAPELAISVVSGSDQTGGLAAALGTPVTVRVTNAQGTPAANQKVEWRVLAGGGATDSTFTTTDANGVTSVRWTLGSDLGIQLLNASAANASISVRASARFQFSSVSVGFQHACALSSSGEAYCWGSNSSGQLGDGTTTSRALPTKVVGNKHFVSISSGWGHTCALASAGQVFCWGSNQSGQLGIGTSTGFSFTPAQVNASASFVKVSAGFVHTCAIAADSAAYCWGGNDNGQLGTGTTTTATSPTRTSGVHNFRSISAGEFHTCATAADGAYCWGWNSTGELGIGAAFGDTRQVPSKVSTLSTASVIAAGSRHTCAVGQAGASAAALYCWGRNAVGETGLPAFQHDALPHVVASPAQFTVLGAGNIVSCGASSAAAYCWGRIGSHTTIAPELRFTGAVSTLSVGFDEACVVSAGDIYCWGSNSDEPSKIAVPQ